MSSREIEQKIEEIEKLAIALQHRESQELKRCEALGILDKIRVSESYKKQK